MANGMMRAVQKMIEPLRRRLSNVIARAVISLVNDSLKLQSLQLRVLADETIDNVERFQEYGFTSVPFAGAECIVLSVGGHRSHSVVVATDDRRYRLFGLAEGEMAIHDDQGQKVHLKRAGIFIDTTLNVTVQAGGTVLVQSTGKTTVEAGATVEIKGETGAAVKGIVQGDCLCAYTGQPHPMVSATVKGSA